MKCSACQFDNEPSARFCANCGAAIQISPRTPPAVASGVRCANCGTVNTPGSMFCENCGTQIGQRSAQAPFSQPAASPQTTAQPSPKTSGAWWFLPIFLGLMGGLVAFLVVRENDKDKAKRLLIVGIVMTFVWPIIYIALALAGILFQM